jgi:hypothetical protein
VCEKVFFLNGDFFPISNFFYLEYWICTKFFLPVQFKIQWNICYCGEPVISHDSNHVSLVQWTNLFAFCHKGHRFKSPGGYLCEIGILLLALSRYIGDPDVIDHQQGFVTVPLDLSQLSCPGFLLTAGLPSGFTTTESAAGGEPCGEPAISHDSNHVSLVQWTNPFAFRHKGHRFKSPGGYLCELGILL